MASAAASPATPAPATMTWRACVKDENSRRWSGCGGGGQGAFGRTRRMRIERRVELVERRAIGADDLAVVAHVEEDVRMIERRRRAHAHELLGADLDDGYA